MCHCAFAPFRQLLPLCGAVVHHGVVAATVAALESECMQLVLPLAWDQPENAAVMLPTTFWTFLREFSRSCLERNPMVMMIES